jgi:hypothetical protein
METVKVMGVVAAVKKARFNHISTCRKPADRMEIRRQEGV